MTLVLPLLLALAGFTMGDQIQCYKCSSSSNADLSTAGAYGMAYAFDPKDIQMLNSTESCTEPGPSTPTVTCSTWCISLSLTVQPDPKLGINSVTNIFVRTCADNFTYGAVTYESTPSCCRNFTNDNLPKAVKAKGTACLCEHDRCNTLPSTQVIQGAIGQPWCANPCTNTTCGCEQCYSPINIDYRCGSIDARKPTKLPTFTHTPPMTTSTTAPATTTTTTTTTTRPSSSQTQSSTSTVQVPTTGASTITIQSNKTTTLPSTPHTIAVNKTSTSTAKSTTMRHTNATKGTSTTQPTSAVVTSTVTSTIPVNSTSTAKSTSTEMASTKGASSVTPIGVITTAGPSSTAGLSTGLPSSPPSTPNLGTSGPATPTTQGPSGTTQGPTGTTQSTTPSSIVTGSTQAPNSTVPTTPVKFTGTTTTSSSSATTKSVSTSTVTQGQEGVVVSSFLFALTFFFSLLT